jgi:NAD(P)-dependent dehydrogenase (short-subunit alcohol dehydrogenase family)
MTRALITGCSTGIGRATALELAKRGYDVVATARRPDTIDDLDVAQRLALDVTSDASVAAAIAATGEIDVLVNNAGIAMGGPIEKAPLDRARALFETNVWGAMRMIQAIAPSMRTRSGGAIVNVTSVAGRVVGPLNGVYSASKFALEALTEGLALELNHWGIRVLAIEPGYIETAIGDNSSDYGHDTPPYDELARIWEQSQARLQGDGEPQGPELVAAAIADALEADDPPLRHPVGADAALIIGTRDSMPYEQFLATMKEFLGLDW